MAVDKRISQLDPVVTPVGTDEFAVNQAGESKKVTLDQIKVEVKKEVPDLSAVVAMAVALG